MRRLLQKIALSLIANSLAVWAVVELLPERISIIADPLWVGIVSVGFILGILNTFVKPILKIITLPFVFLTMGLFLVVINAGLLLLIKWLFSEVFVAANIQVEIIGGFLSYALVGFALAVINTLLHWLLKK